MAVYSKQLLQQTGRKRSDAYLNTYESVLTLKVHCGGLTTTIDQWFYSVHTVLHSCTITCRWQEHVKVHTKEEEKKNASQ